MTLFFYRYADMLIKERAESLIKGQEFLTWNDVQKCIDAVNVQVQEEHERKEMLQIYSSSLIYPSIHPPIYQNIVM